MGGSGVALDIPTKILRKIYNEAIVQDFSSDFERSDPSKTPPSSEVIERILVTILVEDFKRTRACGYLTNLPNKYVPENAILGTSVC